MAIKPTEKITARLGRLVQLLGQFKVVRLKLARLARLEDKVSDLGTRAAMKEERLLRGRLRPPRYGAKSLSRLLHKRSEQKRILRIRRWGQEAGLQAAQLHRDLMVTLRPAAVSDPKAAAVLTQLKESSPYSTLDDLDTIIGLLQELIPPPRPSRRVNVIPSTQAEASLAEVKRLVKAMRAEGLTQKETCERLGTMERPLRAGWRDLTYIEAYRDPRYRAAVRTQLSKWSRE